jgi:2-amino-4-hydroxy-6-hydroxymethyldihydropteridine diphosphokinase
VNKHGVYLGLGSNLDDPLKQLRQAIEQIAQLPESRLLGCSSCYQSRPMGPQDQPDYLNAVVEIETSLAPHTLLQHTQNIEVKQGRMRQPDTRWTARTLDIDILLYDDLEYDTPELRLPHSGITKRDFVLVPLLEIAPDIRLPNGILLQSLLNQVDIHNLCKMHEYSLYSTFN